MTDKLITPAQLVRIFERFEELGGRVTLAKIKAFLLIARTGSIPRLDLKTALGISQGALSELLTGLEEKGLIRIDWDAADGRAQTIGLTHPGKHLLRTIQEEIQEYTS